MTRKTKSEKRPPPERPRPPLSLQQFDHILQTSPDLVGFVDLEGRPLFANDAALRLVGITWEKMLQSEVLDYFVPGNANLSAPSCCLP